MMETGSFDLAIVASQYDPADGAAVLAAATGGWRAAVDRILGEPVRREELLRIVNELARPLPEKGQ